ncbi:MAG: diacylglycerol kinase family protein [Roseburia sp.]|nr:diacylglycerol kinase family protein [Roseburia sp.]
MQYVLFNPLANNKTGEKTVRDYLADALDGEAEYVDITQKDDIDGFVRSLSADDRLILAGGDGTINGFINALSGDDVNCAIDYVPTGSGNDFAKDIGTSEKFIRLNKYIRNLPVVTVKGQTRRFINDVGFGIDGYCCEVGDEFRKKSDKPVNYTSIAIKGLLFHFKPANAVVTVDGERHEFKKVWLAPTMKGRYYGGGMNVAPEQDRLADDGKLTVVVWHGTGKLTTLMRFPKIFKGEHVKYTKMISMFKGSNVTVEFDRPTALQIDGETVTGVTEYAVTAER